MDKPTTEQYNDARANITMLKDCILYEKQQIDELLDKICSSKERIKIYENSLERNKEIITAYEMYEKYENE